MFAVERPVFRFAPSPNGRLHLGHAYSALLNQRLAEAAGGTLLLRMEDIDGERCKPQFAAAIEEDLAWLGVTWTPPVLHQATRFAAYAGALDLLRQQDLTFPCFCARGDIARAVAAHADWPRDPDGSPLYPGTCRGLSPAERARRIAAGRPAVIRLDMAAALRHQSNPLQWLEYGESQAGTAIAAAPATWGDAVLARKDVPTSYHIAVVVDDAAQDVTDVVRGADLRPATSLHRLLQALLGLPSPRYHHHCLILDEAGRKLSKSQNAPTLASLRRAGLTPAAIRDQLDAVAAGAQFAAR